MRTPFFAHSLLSLALLFGAPLPAEASEEEDLRDEAIFGEDPSSQVEEEMQSSLSKRDELTTLGGQLYSRYGLSITEGTPLSKAPFSSPTLTDMYLDARPNERLRGYIRGRLNYNFSYSEESAPTLFTPNSQSSVLLDQLWFKFDIAETLYITLGKQPLRWGSGRFWNPTDFVNHQTRDPFAFVDQRTGVGLLKVHFPIESLGWNLYGILNGDGVRSPEEAGVALRAELLYGTTELALSAANQRGGPRQLGVDVSTGIWVLDFHLEVAAHNAYRESFITSSSSPKTGFPLLGYDPLPVPEQRDEWLYQGVAGVELAVQYSDEDSAYMGAEYFYNQMGYDDPKLFTWLAMTGKLRALYLGAHYASVYLSLPNPGKLRNTSFTLSAMSNLSFESGLLRFDYRSRILTFLDFFAGATFYAGETSDLRFALEVSPHDLSPTVENLVTETLREETGMNQEDADSAVSLLQNGLSSPRQLVNLQLGLRMSF